MGHLNATGGRTDRSNQKPAKLATETVGSAEFWTVGRIAAGLGMLALGAVVGTLGHPGITVDEPLDVRPGRTYVATLRAKGWSFFEPDVVTSVFRDNAEHPPLGRWLLGVASTLGEPFEELLGGSDPFSVHAGRLAPAVCYAILVALVAAAAGRRYGRAAGAVAGASLLLMPRVFAHAHFAALDTFLCLFWTLALLQAERALTHKRTLLAMPLAGFCWGLALLTKIHAWLLPPILLFYVLAFQRTLKQVAAIAVWAVAGLSVYVVGWPWLWYHTIERLQAYLGTGVARATLLVQYFGRVYADRDVPWHYPWFYFAVTVPVGLHALGILGLIQAWRARRTDTFPLLLAGSIAAFLVLFSTRMPVYDGERLFLVVFPLWAIVIGLGFRTAWEWAGRRTWIKPFVITALIAQGYGVVATHPFGLSYYNALVGGLQGAERLGLELTYWGDSIDSVILDELAQRAERGQTAALVPTLHHIQPTAFLTNQLAAHHVTLVDQAAADKADWILVFRRTAYWPPEIRNFVSQRQPLASRTRQGVWLSALWHKPKSTPGAGTPEPIPQKFFRKN